MAARVSSEADPPAVEPSGDRRPGEHVDYFLVLDPEPEPPS